MTRRITDMQTTDNLRDCCVPDVPLAYLDELEAMDGSGSSGSNYGNGLRPRNQQTPKRTFDDEKSSSTSASAFSTSLQDLVESFDKNVGTVLKDMSKNAEQIAPVKIRSQEEIMSESQFWWTLTGNYGNLPPIDFDRSVIRRKQLAALDLQIPKNTNEEGGGSTDPSLSDAEDDGVDQGRLDFHQAAAAENIIGENGETLPVNADRVIEEIDEILQLGDFMHQSLTTQRSTLESFDSMYSSMRSPNVCPVIESDFELKQNNAVAMSTEEMSQYSQSKLLTIISEMEQIIQLYNDELVRELARRDEFEYEKEVRNKFITLLIAVQEQRRKVVNGKRQKQHMAPDSSQPTSNLASVTIPYDDSQEILDMRILAPLIKILQAMADENPQLPNLLTDYILNVICPTNSIASTQE